MLKWFRKFRTSRLRENVLFFYRKSFKLQLIAKKLQRKINIILNQIKILRW